MKHFDAVLSEVLSWLVVFVLGGMVWVVRRVLTNQKQIELMQKEFEHRAKQRDEDRELLKDVSRKVDRMAQKLGE